MLNWIQCLIILLQELQINIHNNFLVILICIFSQIASGKHGQYIVASVMFVIIGCLNYTNLFIEFSNVELTIGLIAVQWVCKWKGKIQYLQQSLT